MKKSIIILSLLTLLSLSASAQKSNWAFFAGYNNAVGNFARVDLPNNDWAFAYNNSTKGGAGYGFNIGFSYRLPLGSSEKSSLVFSADFVWTSSSYAVRNSNNKAIVELMDNFEKVRITAPNFINVPILAGYHYEFGINNKTKMFVEPQVGATFRHITDRTTELIGGAEPLVLSDGTTLYEYSYTDKYNKSLSFAFRLNLGCVFIEHWIVDLAYLHTGPLNIEGFEDYRYSTNSDASNPVSGSIAFTGGRISPMFVTIRFGYRL